MWCLVCMYVHEPNVTCENAILLMWLFPAHFKGCVQDLGETQVAHRAWGWKHT